jgi:hypothetical protein
VNGIAYFPDWAANPWAVDANTGKLVWAHHTNGDTVVYFPNLKVVAVGDVFALPQIPISQPAGAWWAGDGCWPKF